MDNFELKHRAVSKPTADSHEEKTARGKHAEDDGKTKALPSDRAVWVVFFSLLVDLLAFTVILPLFPSLLEFYANNKKVRPNCMCPKLLHNCVSHTYS